MTERTAGAVLSRRWPGPFKHSFLASSLRVVRDGLSKFWREPRRDIMDVSQLMKKNVETCFPEDSLALAAHKMWTRDIGCLPVVSLDSRVVGMITDRDICMSALIEGQPINHISVSTAMSREVHSCTLTESLVETEKMMRANQVRRLPVLDPEGKLIGIISLSDLIREAEHEAGLEEHEISTEEVTSTLAAVCEPRMAEATPRL